MEIFKIAGLGIAAAAIAVFVKNWKPELAMQVSLSAAIVILITIFPYLKTAINMLKDISGKTGLDNSQIGLVLKVVGIAYISQFASELCRDAGENAVATKIELAGKVIIMTLSMPVIYGLMGIVNDIISFEL